MAELELSKIVNMIMENPELVEKIRSMGTEKEADGAANENDAQKAEQIPAISFQAKPSRRRELLSALKSFLSEERQKSLESIMNVADVFDTVRRKE